MRNNPTPARIVRVRCMRCGHCVAPSAFEIVDDNADRCWRCALSEEVARQLARPRTPALPNGFVLV